MFAFELWREFKLSIAEIFKVFPEGTAVFFDKNILILDNLRKEDILEKSKNIWWTIKIIEVKEYPPLTPPLIRGDDRGVEENILSENLPLDNFEWKFNYAINIYWNPLLIPPLPRGDTRGGLKKLLKISKSIIKSASLNPRFINQDFKNVTSVQIIKEALVKKWTDFNFIYWSNGKIFFWNTIFVQDIYAYSNRDYGKDRDMHVWMLPPKLAQMMINLWVERKKENGESICIYDPFVWLWTVLIESVYMWNQKIFGSDLSEKMVETSSENLEKLKEKFSFQKNIFLQNAKYIHEVNIFSEVDVIVTEWYLWEIMTKNNINLERIEKQRKKLSELYEWFFSWLKNKNFKWNIVISFPFWEMNSKYFYFEEIYDIINKYCNILEILPENFAYLKTKVWSLLYKRENQLVGREIFVLKIK